MADSFVSISMANAERLWSDSKLLNDGGRTASAVMLAIFAIEEFGKALIVAWGVKNKASRREHPSHVEKQAAMFALLVGRELWDDREGTVKALREGTLNCLTSGPYAYQFAQARSGFFDDFRMAVTYADAAPKLPREILDRIDGELVDELHGFYLEAVAAASDQDAMEMAALIYTNGLGRL